mmetsp:Transcript_29418/g.68371  ORF Transcript_29418/g.68371 Transcript_29418/m.68371 type:complete len:657 (+) Transcript_29418:76-2046(+)
MGGASSYYAMLSICAFLCATWGASKFSRLIGISSIVLEITTGVVLGPKVVGLIVEEYAVCEHAAFSDCSVPLNAEQLAKDGRLGEYYVSKFNTDEFCAHYLHESHGHGAGEGHSEGGHNEGEHSELHGQEGHTEGHGGESHGAVHNESSLHEGAGSHQDGTHNEHGDTLGEHSSTHEEHAHEGDHGSDGHTRRLSGGNVHYESFSECLSKTCEIDVNHHCGLTPDVFTLIGHAGVALMIFESGMHFDFEQAKVVGVPACIVAVVGTILPLVVGSALMVAFGRPLMPQGVSAGTALAPTSVGIALRLLGEAGVLQQQFGQAIITAAFVDDILSLVLFNVLFSLGGEFDLFKVVLAPIIGIAFMLFAMGLAVKFWPTVINRIIIPQAPESRETAGLTGWRRIRLEQDELLFLLQIVFVVAFSLITHLLGTHLWGCFIAGMSFACLDPPHHAHHVWVKQTKRVTTWMVRIFFSATVAFSIPVAKLLSISAFWKGSIMGIFACILTKVVCAPFMGPARWVIGWAMVGRAEFAYLIAQMALSGNMLDQESFSIVIWALLYATIFAPFIFRYLLNRYVKQQGLQTNQSLKHADEEGVNYGEAHAEPNKSKPLFGNGLEDLDNIDVGNLKGKPAKKSLGADAAPAKPSDSFLCCLFFRRLIVQ